tara:strand:+ start:233 stop:547 length:315 start_codon:yes stop_codon:yes gene_type:complete
MIKYAQLVKSKISGKKYTMIFYDADKKKVKTTHFGQAGAKDYISHIGTTNREERKTAYINRHKSNESWNTPTSAGSLAKHILWNKTSLSASYSDYLRKFNLSKY